MWPRRRPPFTPDQPVHPRVRHLAVHDAVFPQRTLTNESELLQNAGRSSVASIGLGLNAIQVQRPECPLQQSPSGLRCVAVSPRAIVKAVAQRRAAVVRVPLGQAAPSDEGLVGNTVNGQSSPTAFFRQRPQAAMKRSARARSVQGGASQYRNTCALLCSAKRTSASALVSGRNRRRAVRRVGVGKDMDGILPCSERRTAETPSEHAALGQRRTWQVRSTGPALRRHL